MSADVPRSEPSWRSCVRQLLAAAIVALVWTALVRSPTLPRRLGFGEHGAFFDGHGTLAAVEAASRGLDPYAINPLDPSGRAHLYSSWWLALGRLGLTRDDTVWLGVFVVGLVLVVAIAGWRMRTWREAGIAIAMLVSPAWLMAVYRANIDLVIFVGLALALWCLQRPQRWARVTAAALVGGLAILKYFPAAAAIGLLRAPRPREVVGLLAVFAAVVAIGWPSILPALSAVAKYGPESQGLQAFGVAQLARAAPPGTSIVLIALLCCAGVGLGFRLGKITPAAMEEEPRADRTMAATVAGMATVTAFVLGASYFYKLIFLWWLLVWVAQDGPEMLGRRRSGILFALVLTLAWADGVASVVLNTFGPTWSAAQRRFALSSVQTLAVVTQFGYWILMGACSSVAAGWTRQRLAWLAK